MKSLSQISDGTRTAMEKMKRYCDAHPQSPCALRRPQLLVRGGVWIALLGPSISEGITGFGYTVEAALRAFDAQYLRGSGKASERTVPVSELQPTPELSQPGHTPGNLCCA